MEPDSDTNDYAQEWEELDAKVLLAQLLAEQQRTNRLLAALGDTDAREPDGDDPTMFECHNCGATVAEDEREDHARGKHKAPPGMAETMFTATE